MTMTMILRFATRSRKDEALTAMPDEEKREEVAVGGRGGGRGQAVLETFAGRQQSTLLAPSFEDEDEMRTGKRMDERQGKRERPSLIRSQNAAAELRSR
ncbi:hypothetical protein ACS0PU_001498 [Formica fusca]